MKILYFHQHFSVPTGSGGTRSYEIAKRMTAAGHSVVMVCGMYAGSGLGDNKGSKKVEVRKRVQGFDVIQLNLPYSNRDGFLKRSWTFLRFAWRSIRIALREPHDVLFATSTPLTAALPGIAARWLKGSRFVFEVRDLWPELPVAMGVIRNPLIIWSLKLLEWLAYTSAHGLVGLSPGIVEGMRRRSSPDKHCIMVPNGSDLSVFVPGKREKSQSHQVTFVFTGAHGLANGLDSVLDAASELKTRDDISIEFIGDGSQKDRLKERAQKEKIQLCKFLDPIPKFDLAKKLSEVDAGLMILANVPAFYDGTSPNKFFDYLSAGLPILVNYPGWVADIVRKENCGIAVPPDDRIAFAEAISYLADNPEKRAEMGKNSRRVAETYFDRDKQASELIEFILSFAKPKS